MSASRSLRSAADTMEALGLAVEELLRSGAHQPAAERQPDPDEYLTYQEAAQELRMSPDFVRGLCRKGHLPVAMVSNRRKIRRGDLEDYKRRRVVRRRVD